MGKLLRARDILLLTLAGIGDVAEEVRDPLSLMGSAYKSMYGFVPRRYKRHNFLQLVNRNLKTGNIEKIIKDGKAYLRLTSAGKGNIVRDFPILNLTKKWNRKWVIIVFDIEEKSKSVRNNLRNKLKSLGFGMLQESVWISPLSIGKDLREFIHSVGLSQNVFVMDVSGFILGDPKQLARSIWNLDELENEYVGIEKKVNYLNQLIKYESDRINKSEGGVRKDKIYELLRKKRIRARKKLEFVAYFPPLPKELLPNTLRNII